MQAMQQENDVVYAGFWRRWAALFLDQLILGTVFYAVLIVVLVAVAVATGTGASDSFDPDHPPAWVVTGYFIVFALYYVGAGLYYALMESSRHQATVGKMALGIKVTDGQGRRLSFGRALGRWFAAALSYMALYIGFLMAAFTERKRALHDMVADTLVVDRWAWTDRPDLQRRGFGGCLVAIILGAVLGLVAVVAILAAIAIPAYNDYVQRSKVMQAVSESAPLRVAIMDFQAREGRCPGNGEAGIPPESSPGITLASRLAAGTFNDGSCGIELELGDTGHPALDSGRIWWELGPDGRWECSSSLADHLLPEECRG